MFGRILAIATEYDDLVQGYFRADGVISTKAERIIWENKDNKFDPEILKIFMHRTITYKVCQPYFDYNNNEKGIIMGFSNYVEAPHKPIVKFSNGETRDYYL